MTVHRFLQTSLAIGSSLVLLAPATTLAASASSAVTVTQSQNADWVPANRGGTVDQSAVVNTWTSIDGQVAAQSRTDAGQHMWSFGPMHQEQKVADGVMVSWNNNQWPTNASVDTAFKTDQQQHGAFMTGTQAEQRSVSTLRSNVGSTEANADSNAHQTLVADAAQSQQTQGATHVDGWFNPPMPGNSGHAGWLGNIFQNVNVFVQNTINW